MWFVTRIFNQFLKLFARIYYIGRPRAGALSTFYFGKTKFYARHNTLDAFALHEIWRYNSYGAAAINPGYTVLDIGAHIGGYSIFAAAHGARVIAYEAMPGTYDLLMKNLEANRCTAVNAYNVAVSSKNGKIVLNSDSEGTILSSVYADKSFPNQVVVPSITLHEALKRNNLKRIDILKLDVEGAEYDILLNANPADMQKIRTVVMEYHDHLEHGHNKKELIAFLTRNGFEVKERMPRLITAIFKEGQLLATRKNDSASNSKLYKSAQNSPFP